MVKKVLLSLLALLLVVVTLQVFMKDWAYDKVVNGLISKRVEIIKPAEIEDLSNYLVLDTRGRNEFEVSHLPGAIWVGYKEFKLQEVSALQDVQKPVLLYCSVGKRSGDIGEQLLDAGYKDVKNLYGGIFKWVNDGKEVVNENGATQQIHAFSKTWGIWLNKGEKVY
jgi:rhodanese-related sulfurtransferase